MAQLSFMRRMRLALRLDTSHNELLEQLRTIIRDEAPRYRVANSVVVPKLAISSGPIAGTGESFDAPISARYREKKRKQTGVNATLAAANATRVSINPLSEDAAALTRALAQADRPEINYNGNPDDWWRHQKYQSGIWKKIGKDKPATPRRI